MDPLVKIVAENSSELLPIPTDVTPRLPQLSDIKCVLFDVYGTLMVSGVGDISHSSDDNRKSAIIKTLKSFDISINPEVSDPGTELKSVILDHQAQQRKKGVQYPEVDIREVWSQFLSSFTTFSENPDAQLVEKISIRFELLVNSTWPMPGLGEVLNTLKTRGTLMGIVSNAQFFTPLLFEGYLNQTTEELGFTDSLCQWSYAYKEAKPSEHLYALNVEQLEKHHDLKPEQVLYVGNDMLNDITPAQAVGFKTALFAGDQRSLRWRENDDRTKEVVPDLVITELAQILGCI